MLVKGANSPSKFPSSLDHRYDAIACQLFEKRLTSSRLAPLYSDSAELWNWMIQAKFVNGRTDE